MFEYKGVEGYPEPYVPINQKQLLTYFSLNEQLGATLVWYLLPAWNIKVTPGQILPAAAEFRVLRAADPRPDWRSGVRRPDPALVASATGARDEMALARGCESFFYIVDPERLIEDGRLRTFPGWNWTDRLPSRPCSGASGGTNT